MSFKDQLNTNKIPEHVAIIMDGNGRWAEKKGEHRVFGHTKGVESVREALTAAGEIGVKYLTLYAFSTENWNRPKEEVDALMDLLVKTITMEVDSLNENDVRLHVIGDLDSLPPGCKEALEESIEETKNNTRVNLILALSYSSRWEITRAIKNIVEDVQNGDLNSDDIDTETIDNYLNTVNFPEPELLIRTSGERRISNFLLWQLAYSELYFTETLWPDFKKENFFEAIYNYQKRERRFGKTSAQLLSDD
ncbi:isoprenyl transferase [Parvicella tangerina]|uniref:Isoprenyl transferase n=1 Tax=Parvicella tangerina TaxID=2829795 RepID=A0A916JLC9_9FLAO|nr:isoprenyl transferase [Parvicella tangerina]CAG5080044.1 Isoprenyl transferase [Parvicella tangerina]